MLTSKGYLRHSLEMTTWGHMKSPKCLGFLRPLWLVMPVKLKNWNPQLQFFPAYCLVIMTENVIECYRSYISSVPNEWKCLVQPLWYRLEVFWVLFSAFVCDKYWLYLFLVWGFKYSSLPSEFWCNVWLIWVLFESIPTNIFLY